MVGLKGSHAHAGGYHRIDGSVAGRRSSDAGRTWPYIPVPSFDFTFTPVTERL